MGKRSGWWITHSLTGVVGISFVAPYIDVIHVWHVCHRCKRVARKRIETYRMALQYKLQQLCSSSKGACFGPFIYYHYRSLSDDEMTYMQDDVRISPSTNGQIR